MWGPLATDAYLYLYAAAIRAGAADPEAVARKGAEDFEQFRKDRRALEDAEDARRDAERKAAREAAAENA